jgi:tetratricopeptide (TPR) repeat protein
LQPAEWAYRDVLKVNPRHAGALSHLGVLAHQVGRRGDAVALLRQALDATRRDPQIHFNLALVLSSSGQDEEALAHNLKALKIKPDYADAHSNMGTLLLRSGRAEEAIKHFNRALLFAPSGVARENLVKALLAAGKTKEVFSAVIEAPSREQSEELQRAFTFIVTGTTVRDRFPTKNSCVAWSSTIARSFHLHATCSLDVSSRVIRAQEPLRALAARL